MTEAQIDLAINEVINSTEYRQQLDILDDLMNNHIKATSENKMAIRSKVSMLSDAFISNNYRMYEHGTVQCLYVNSTVSLFNLMNIQTFLKHSVSLVAHYKLDEDSLSTTIVPLLKID